MAEISEPKLTQPICSIAMTDRRGAQQPTGSKQPRICVFCSTQRGKDESNAAAATALAQALHSHGAQLVYGGGATGLMGVLARERVRLGGPESVLGVIPYALVDTERQGKGKDGIPGMTMKKKKEEEEGAAAAKESEKGSEGGTIKGAKGKIKGMLSSFSSGGKGRIDHDASGNEGDEEEQMVNSSKQSRKGKRKEGEREEDKKNNEEAQEDWQTWDGVYALPTDQTYGRVVGTPSMARRKAVMISATRQGGAGSGFVALPGGFGSLDEVLTVLTARQQGQHGESMVLVNVDGFWDGLDAWMQDAGDKGFLGPESRGFVKTVDSAEEAVVYLIENREWAV